MKSDILLGCDSDYHDKMINSMQNAQEYCIIAAMADSSLIEQANLGGFNRSKVIFVTHKIQNPF